MRQDNEDFGRSRTTESRCLAGRAETDEVEAAKCDFGFMPESGRFDSLISRYFLVVGVRGAIKLNKSHDSSSSLKYTDIPFHSVRQKKCICLVYVATDFADVGGGVFRSYADNQFNVSSA